MNTKNLHVEDGLREGIFAFLSSHIKASILVVDREGKVAFLNTAAENLLHTKFVEVTGKSGDLLFPGFSIHSSGLEGLVNDIYDKYQRLKTDEEYDSEPLVLLSSRGIGKRAQLTLSFTPFSHGNNFFIVIAITSSSFLSGPPKELELSDELYRLIIDTAATAIFTVDLNMQITDINDEFTHITGFTREDVIGKHCSILKGEPCLEECGLYALKDDERIFKRECRLLAKDGSHRVVMKNAALIRQPNGEICGGVESFVDITNMRTALEKAEEASAAKSSFLAMMSHEIRTPMNGIMGLAELLEGSRLSPSDSELVQTIRHSATSLLSLLNDILDFSKGEAGKFERHDVSFDLRHELKALSSVIIPSTNKKNLDFKITVEDSIPPILEGDVEHLRQILLNLLTNAVKFTSTGSIGLSVTIIRIAGAVHFLQFEVTDTGIGISDNEISTIFEPFMQAYASISSTYGGTGLGLAICSRLVKLLNGELLVESELNEGSKFIVQLPFRVTAPGSKSSIIASSSASRLMLNALSVSLQNEKKISKDRFSTEDNELQEKSLPVLVADDNSINRMVARRMLSRLGFKFHIVDSGAEVITELKNKSYSMILLDRRMPHLDGLETARAIRGGIAGESVRNIPIVAMTASVYAEDKEECYAAGMNDFICKPIDLDTLNQIVTRILIDQKEQPIIDVFRGNCQERVITLSKALKEKDFERIREECHSLLGSSGTLGFSELYKVACKCEKSAIDKDFDTVTTLVKEIDSLVTQTFKANSK